MQDFTVIPVIDLKGSVVVHARAGARAEYRPIETPFGPADDPIWIARGLITIAASPVLYVADLDAIEGRGNHFGLCQDLADALPGTALWIDAGFASAADCVPWLPLGATLVIGSESLPAIGNWRELRSAYGEGLVLSLDFAAERFRGPAALLSEPALWPDRIIVMCLGRVGTDQGPDIERLQAVTGQAGSRAVYAAGGVRSIANLEAIADTGARGALIATALHQGTVSQNEIAALKGGRRSRSD